MVLSKKFTIGLLALIGLITQLDASSNNLTKDLAYYDIAQTSKNSYMKERSVLDVYCPSSNKLLPTIVWFHGGGLLEGEKHIPEELKNQNVCVVAPNYRLHPQVKSPVYIQDAAAAVAWVFNNIKPYGGDPSLIFISGHSAGGYLTSMLGLDKRWLAAHQINANNIAGLIPLSGHAITHFTIRKERGIKATQPIIDEMAPLYHIRADAPPLLLITGDRKKEMLGRYEENAYLARMMKVVGHQETTLFELQGYGHNIIEPALPLLLNEIKRVMSQSNE